MNQCMGCDKMRGDLVDVEIGGRSWPLCENCAKVYEHRYDGIRL